MKKILWKIFAKATELGVSKIIPIVSERTEVKELNHDRAKKIVTEATEQSNQFKPPEISQIIKLKDFINNINGSSKLFFADINSKEKLKKTDIEENNLKILLIGPEGDFSHAEREIILQNKNTIPFSISENILRSDTATISALSLLCYSLIYKIFQLFLKTLQYYYSELYDLNIYHFLKNNW